MYINGTALLLLEPIVDMVPRKVISNGVSYGLTELGYDIRVKQDIRFLVNEEGPQIIIDGKIIHGRFCLASSVELFDMPESLGAEVKNKSSWARHGVDAAFSTVIEPGWRGYLTLEIVFHGNEPVHIPAGSGIVQCLFQHTTVSAAYDGKYQDQPDNPVQAIYEKKADD